MILNLIFILFSYLPVGVPNISGASTVSTTNYLAVKKGYIMSYNGVEGRANWVGWTLRASDLGPVERSNRFKEDPNLPNSFKRVDDDDYRESGYDRGHLCNSEDRTATEYLNEETFLMSNMLPQTPELNRGPFKFLEEYCRKLVIKKGQELLIYSGGVGAKGRLASGVPIPMYCWKVVYTPQEVFYVLFPNERTLSKNWKNYVISKDRLEKMTGFQFP